jgi:hypothetical protein
MRERRPSLQVPEVFRIDVSANIVVKAESVRVNAICRPLRPGSTPPFIGHGGGSLQACRIVLSTCGGMAYSVVE